MRDWGPEAVKPVSPLREGSLVNSVRPAVTKAEEKISYRRIALVAWVAFIFVGLTISMTHFVRLWQLDANGLSLATSKPPTWDFTNLWYGGRLALDGRTDVLFDVETYRAGLRSIFHPAVDDSEWSYPPTLLLIGAPLALLSLFGAYAVWTIGTLGLLLVAMRRAGFPAGYCFLICLSPAVLNNMLFGQNGALTSALFVAGLVVARSRPILAGLCFAVLTIKPHLGLLVPVCLVAAGKWRAILWSVALAAVMVGVTTLLFGTSVWLGFQSTTQPLMRAIMEAPYGQGYHANAATTFVLARFLGLGVAEAYLAQAAVALIASLAAWRLWRDRSGDPLLRVGATAVLALLATPYGYSYDMVMLAVATLAVLDRGGMGYTPALIPIWLWPGMVNGLNSQIGPFSSVMLIFAAVVCVHAYVRSRDRHTDGMLTFVERGGRGDHLSPARA